MVFIKLRLFPFVTNSAPLDDIADTKPPQDKQQNKSYIGNIIEYSPNPSEPSFFDNIIEKTNLNTPIVILEMERTIVSL